jgi:hypothetical protein
MILDVSLTPSRKSASRVLTCVCNTTKNILVQAMTKKVDDYVSVREICVVISAIGGKVSRHVITVSGSSSAFGGCSK